MKRCNLEELDPRTKIAAVFSISCASFFIRDFFTMVLLLLFTMALLVLSGVGPVRQAGQVKGILGMAVLVMVLQCLAGRAAEGIRLALRLVIFGESALLLLTSPLRDYLLALVQWKLPYELAFMIVLAFRFFPLLRREALDVYDSMRLRGMDLKQASLSERLGAYVNMCRPILWAAMERARDMSTAMEARGFRSSGRRTYMRKLKLTKKDIAVMATVLLAAAGLAGYSRQAGRTGTVKPQNLGMEVILSMKGGDVLTVSWSDHSQYTGILQWGDEKIEAEAVCIQEGSYYRYLAETPELERGKTYTYTVGSQEKRSPFGTYVCPSRQEPFSFLYMGDIQYSLRERDYEIWGRTLADACRRNPDMHFGILGGDMVENGSDRKDWNAFLKNGEGVFSQLPMMTTPGNHETSIYPQTYLDMMGLPDNSPLREECYSFTYGSCQFLVLNSCLFMEERMEEPGYEQTMGKVNQWIAGELGKDLSSWKVVVMHHPLYPVTEDDEIYQRIRGSWESLFIQGGVDLLLCGHQHVYMRTEPIHGITAVMADSGEKKSYYIDEAEAPADYAAAFQAGIPNYVKVEVSAAHMALTAYSREGEKIDAYQWKK